MEEKSTNKELIATNLYLKTVLESINEVFFVLETKDLIVTYFNKAAERLLNKKAEQVINKPLFEAFPEAKNSVFETNYRKAFNEKTSLKFETYFGKEPYSNWYKVSVYYDKNKITVLFQVITEIKEAQLDLQAANQQLVANEQQLKATNQQLLVNEQQLLAVNQQLIENENKLKEVQQMAGLGYWYWNVKTGDVEWSEDVYKIFHCDPNEFKPQIDSILALSSKWPEDSQRDRELIEKAIKSHEMGYYEQKFLRPNGSIGHYASTFQGIYDKEGELTAMKGTVQDITERKKAEETLRLSQEKLQNTFDLSTSIIARANLQSGYFIEANNAVTKILGYSVEEFTSKPFMELIHPDDRQESAVEKDEQINGKEVVSFENRYLCKDGKYKWIDWFGTKADKNGIVTAVGTDITEKKKAEEALLLSKEETDKNIRFLNTLINTLPDLIWLKDSDGIYLNCNKRFEDFFGKNESEIIGKTDYDFVSRELANFFRQNDKLSMKAGKPTINEEEISFASDGHSEILETIKTPLFDQNHKIIGVLGVGRDITKRKKAEAELKKTHRNLTRAQEIGKIGTWTYDIQSNVVNWTDENYKIYGIEEGTKITSDIFLNNVHPEDRENVNKKWKEALSGEIYDNEYRLLVKDNIKWIREKADIFYNNKNEPITAIGLTQDITEKKESEEALKKSEARYKQLVETASDAIYLMDETGIIIDANDLASKMLKKKKEEIIGSPIDTVDPNYPVKDFVAFWKETPFNEQRIFETTHITKNEEMIPVEVSGKRFRIDNKIYYFGVARDITERKKAEDKLNSTYQQLQANEQQLKIANQQLIAESNKLIESEEKYRFITESTIDIIWHLDVDENKFIYLSPSLKQNLGFNPNEIIGKGMDAVIKSSSLEKLGRDVSDRIERFKSGEREVFIDIVEQKHKDGSSVWMEIQASYYRNSENGHIEAVGVSRNITEKKKAEEKLQSAYQQLQANEQQLIASNQQLIAESKKLKASEKEMKAVFDTAVGGMRVIGSDFKIKSVNNSFCKMLDLTHKDLIGKNCYDVFWGKRCDTEECPIKILQRESVSKLEIEINKVRPDGKEITTALASTPLNDNQGNFIGIVEDFRDITERKKAEEERLEHKRHMDVLKDIGILATSTLDIKQLLMRVLEGALKAVGTSVGMIFLKEISTGKLSWGASAGLSDAFVSEFENSLVEPGEGLSGLISETGETIFIPENSSNDKRISREVVKKENLHSFIGVPIYADDDIIGVLNILSRAPKVLNEKEVVLVSAIGAYIGSAINNARLFKQLNETKEILTESEEKYRSLVENIKEFVFLIDKDYKILSLNQSAQNLIDVKENYVGKSIKDVFPAHIYEDYSKGLKYVFDTGEYLERDTKLEIGKQKLFIHASLSPLKNETGEVTAVVGLSRDITEQKIAELNLRDREQKLRSITENSTNLFYQHTPQHKLTYLSPQVKDILGYTVEEALVKWTDLATDHPINKDGFNSTMRALETGEAQPAYNLELKHKSGHKVWVEVREAPLIEKGKVIGIVGALTDNTEQRFAQNELKKSEERYRKLFESANAGIGISTVKGKIIAANNALSKIFGYTKQELLDISIIKLYKDINDRKKLLEIVDKKGEFQNLHLQMVKKNGEHLDVHMSVQAIDKSKDSHMLFVISDVTGEKKAERELLEQAEKFKTYIESSPVAVFISDGKGKYIYVNDAATSMLDYTREELLNKHIPDLQLKENIEYEFNSFLKVKEEGFIKGHKSQLIKKNGEIVNTDISAVKIDDDQYLAFCTDISKLRKYELDLERNIERIRNMNKDLKIAKEKAEESDRLKSAFLANMSHEIRTPMNGIIGFTNLLKEPELSSDNQKKYVDIIDKSGQRMLNTIQDIIDISKIEAGQVSVSLSEINLNSKIDELFEFFLPEARKKNIGLSINKHLADHRAIIKTDNDKLNSILTNLIKNAIKFTHLGTIEFGYVISKNEFEFYVKDTGIGIPKERQQAVFNRFEQADIEDKNVYEGSGLGLAISKAYVEMLGGKIWVESEEGSGSEFYFSLPYQSEEKTNMKKDVNKIDKLKAVKKNLKILIVEDEEFVIEYLQIILQDYGKEIIVRKTGTEAVEICKRYPDINLVLMDIKIPGLNGYEATRKIREFNKDVLIIAQTAYAQKGDIEKCLEAGCNDYISKPINKKNLLEKISTLIQ